MLRPSRALLAILAPLVLVVGGVAAPAALAATPTTVSGTVVDDATGEPIRGVQVWVTANGSKYDYLGGTNSEGEYKSPHGMSHTAGLTNIVFVDSANHFASDYLEGVTLATGENNAITEMRLEPGATVTGTITAPSGALLKNVKLVLADNDDPIDPDYVEVTTAEDGTYEAKPLGSGDFEVLLPINNYSSSRSVAISGDGVIPDQDVITKVPVSASFTGSSPSKKKATLKVSVSAATYGITNPGGKVTVYDGSKAIKSNVPLVGGKATISLSGLKKGTHKFKVKYLGATDTVAKFTSVRSVKVK